MSEELKQKAREELSKAAAQFVIDRAKMRGLTIDQFLQGNAVGLMAEFASQVCEQREKEPFPKRSEVCISLFGCCDSEETWRPGIEGWGDSDEKSRSNGYISVGDYDELFNRAEAAELALQTAKKELAENEAMDDGNCRAFKLLEERNAELLLALQAKEQELGRVTELCVEYGIVDVHGGIDTDTLKHTLEDHARWKKDVVKQSVEIERLKRELAQARQQAIADQSETIDILKRGLQNAIIYEGEECYYRVAVGMLEVPKRYEMPIRVAMETILRSLTPPPALTKEK